MKKTAVGIVVAAVLVLLPLEGASGQLQLSIGAHASYVPGIGTGATAETADGSVGVGARLGIGISSVGIRLLGSVERFFPDCGSEDCEFEVGTANVIYDLPTSSALSLYLGAGISAQNADGGASIIGNRSDWGVNLMAGFSLGSGNLSPFVEARYQLMPDFDNQLALSAGLTLSTQ